MPCMASALQKANTMYCVWSYKGFVQNKRSNVQRPLYNTLSFPCEKNTVTLYLCLQKLQHKCPELNVLHCWCSECWGAALWPQVKESRRRRREGVEGGFFCCFGFTIENLLKNFKEEGRTECTETLGRDLKRKETWLKPKTTAKNRLDRNRRQKGRRRQEELRFIISVLEREITSYYVTKSSPEVLLHLGP